MQGYVLLPWLLKGKPYISEASLKWLCAFCIDDSSRRLSNQYLIRDHMAVHYNKILSAKAAVDCSVPKSRLNSIKLSDQQRREKLKKEVEKCEREMISSKNESRSSSRESKRPLSATYRKDTLEAEDNIGLPSCTPSEQRCVLGPQATPERQNTSLPNAANPARKDAPKASNISDPSSCASTPSLQRLPSKISSNSSSDSIANKHLHKAPNPEPKVCSGDLLDKHSEHFTNARQPFTPRTLKSDAKSFLSQYRYYKPARQKISNITKQVEAETQTDISSFQVASEGSEKSNMADFQKMIKEVEDNADNKADEMKSFPQFSSPRVTSPSSAQSPTMKRIQADFQVASEGSEKSNMADFQKMIKEVEDNADNKADEMKSFPQFSSPRVTSPSSAQSPTMKRIQAEEEELLYLNFIQDITDEILKLGLFSNRALEMLFERHIEQNKNHLDETKMRHLLEILKVDLGCSKEEKPAGGLDMFGLRRPETTEHRQHRSKAQRQNKPAKSEVLLKAVDLNGNDPAVSPLQSDDSEKVEGKAGFPPNLSEPVSMGLDPSSFVVTDETADTSCTLPPALSSTTCDADFETSDSLREVDELKESFAESLSISTDNTL
ncbi:spermatogenesis-associated protein 7 isoform X2 [Lacerta agilis]|uniref:spermatogenesis-associated protein 7 isoform X2 n=1 Tax=Lacerta agilis TaxID=80427 RepID=UPI0014192457|nr:spermatogenesis-associated protein 7 isoform X2 [Lacerta agilis]